MTESELKIYRHDTPGRLIVNGPTTEVKTVMTEPQYVFYVESMAGARSGQPAVIVTVNGADFTVNLTTTEARELAANILGAAEAAEGDAFLVAFLCNELGADPGQAVAVLAEFRKYRELWRAT